MIALPDRPVVLLSAAAAGLVNSLYLAGLSLDGFLHERGVEARVAEFTIPFFTVPIFFLCLHLAYICRSFGRGRDGRWSIGSVVFGTPVIAFDAVFILAFAFMLHHGLTQAPQGNVLVFVPLAIEIGAALFVAGREKERRVGRQLFVYVLWGVSVMAGFTATGVYEKIGYPPLGNELKLVYCGILLHLTNAAVFARALLTHR